jgi:hypothetical protein
MMSFSNTFLAYLLYRERLHAKADFAKPFNAFLTTDRHH